MKISENTKVKIRVPKRLYEAVQAEMNKHEMEEGDNYEMEEGLEEDFSTGAEMAAKQLFSQASAENTFALGVATVLAIVAGVAAGPKVVDKLKGYYQALKGENPKQAELLAKQAKEAGVNMSGAAPSSMEEVEEVAETMDLETLMEAIKEASKKAKDKKKKTEEAKKKALKEAEDEVSSIKNQIEILKDELLHTDNENDKKQIRSEIAKLKKALASKKINENEDSNYNSIVKDALKNGDYEKITADTKVQVGKNVLGLNGYFGEIAKINADKYTIVDDADGERKTIDRKSLEKNYLIQK